MHNIIKWVSEARPDKEIGPAMTHYLVRGGEIRATNGVLTASYPWPDDDACFLVSGAEFERVIARMTEGDVEVTQPEEQDKIVVRSGRFSATIATLPPDAWAYPGVEDAQWRDVPDDFVEIMKSLRAFIADKPAQAWQGCVALEHGNMYATNGIAVAGSACEIGDVQALLPASAIDFVLRRLEGLEQWSCNENYIAFRWQTDAWMRVQSVLGRFHERAAEMVRNAYELQPSQEITDEFRDAFADVAGLAEDTIRIYRDKLESKFKRSVVVAPIEDCEVPPDSAETYIDDKGRSKKRTVPGGVSVWGAAYLAPVISQATHWQPSLWPKPVPFRGDNIAGLIVGRKSSD